MTGIVFVMFYYLFIICGNLSKQFFSIVQLFRGEYKQYHSGLFLVGTVHIIFICEAFGNSRIFPTSNKPGKSKTRMPVLSRTGNILVQMLVTRNFPDFSGKIRFLRNGIRERNPLTKKVGEHYSREFTWARKWQWLFSRTIHLSWACPHGLPNCTGCENLQTYIK